MTRVLRQFWRLLSLAINAPGGRVGIVLYAVVLGLELCSILVSLRTIEWSKAFYDALQQMNAAEALAQVGVFGIIVAVAVGLTLGSTFVRKHLEIRWRSTLTRALLDRWLGSAAYLKLQQRQRKAGDTAVNDNPDQRIAEDARMFLAGPMGEHGGGTGIIPLSLDLISNIVAIFSYLAVLWSLSEFALTLAPIGIPVEVPRYMVWAAFLYVILCTGLTHWLGRPLKGLYFQQQRREADFRFGLVRVRENAEAVALSQGETAERRTLDGRFGEIVRNWKQLINRELKLMSFTYPYRFTVLRIPTFLALPAFFGGAVTFGGLMQLASAFSSVVTTLSWFIFSYRPLADLVAASARLAGFLDATDEAAGEADGFTRAAGGPTLSLGGVTIATPDGRSLLSIPALDVRPGEAVWLAGASGLGKTTLLKAIAGVWGSGSGGIAAPVGRTLFLPQRPYLPLGSLLAAVAYPTESGDHDPEVLRAALRDVGLGDRLLEDEQDVTLLGLSGGEQQRLALARVLVQQPDWLFLDEATSALDIAAERELLVLLRARLPNTAIVVVAHRQPQGLGPIRTVDLNAPAPEPAPTTAIPVPA